MAADAASALVVAAASTFNFPPAGSAHCSSVPCLCRDSLCTMPRHAVVGEMSFLHQHPCHGMFGPAWPRRATHGARVHYPLPWHPSPRACDAKLAPRLPCEPAATAQTCTCTAPHCSTMQPLGNAARAVETLPTDMPGPMHVWATLCARWHAQNARMLPVLVALRGQPGIAHCWCARSAGFYGQLSMPQYILSPMSPRPLQPLYDHWGHMFTTPLPALNPSTNCGRIIIDVYGRLLTWRTRPREPSQDVALTTINTKPNMLGRAPSGLGSEIGPFSPTTHLSLGQLSCGSIAVAVYVSRRSGAVAAYRGRRHVEPK